MFLMFQRVNVTVIRHVSTEPIDAFNVTVTSGDVTATSVNPAIGGTQN